MTVGIGGSYIAVAGDFAAIGTADHSLLVNRNLPDQHETADITGLDADQAAQDAATALVQTNLDDYETDNDAAQAVQDSRLGTLETRADETDTEQGIQDGDIQTNADNFANHLVASDPHPQYALEAAVLANFVAAGYVSVGNDAPEAFPDITSTFQTYSGWDSLLLDPPRNAQNALPDGLIFEANGVWQINVRLAITHNESNAGRIMQLRFINVTTNTPSLTTFNFATGRNVATTNLNIPLLFEVSPLTVGNTWGVQLGTAGDTYSAVSIIGGTFSAFLVSEWQGAIP